MPFSSVILQLLGHIIQIKFFTVTTLRYERIYEFPYSRRVNDVPQAIRESSLFASVFGQSVRNLSRIFFRFLFRLHEYAFLAYAET